MPQVYNLDLETMLFTLSRRQLSGSLVADVPKGRVGKELTHIELSVDSGKVVYCSLKSGQTYVTGENALQIIARLDVIPWSFTSSLRQSAVTLAQPLLPPGPIFQTHIPKRSKTLQSSELAQLPRTHFQVYAYIDGKRTVEELARLLRTTNEQIERILFDLRMWKVVQNN